MKIYKYFFLNKDLFASITDLNLDKPEDYLNYFLKNNYKHIPKKYDLKYLTNRLSTEKEMYYQFLKKGGKPTRKHPYYFTLGKCDEWFYGIKKSFGSMEFDLCEFSLNKVSFTYGDSIPTFMEEFNDGKEYRKKIYTYKEILKIINKYGYPQNWNLFEKFGPENYIEVQVWDGKLIDKLRYSNKIDNLFYVISEITRRVMYANNLSIYYSDYGLDFFCKNIKKNKHWKWFNNLFAEIKYDIFTEDVIHGVNHAIKCALMALFISDNYLNENKKTLVLAALYHDIGRVEAKNGKNHGEIGAKKVEKYIKNIANIDIAILKKSIMYHDKYDYISNNDILNWLKDIDSLDYIRFGIGKFNVNFLIHDTAKKIIRLCIEFNMLLYFLDNDVNKFMKRILHNVNI